MNANVHAAELAELRKEAGYDVKGETPCELCHETAEWLEGLMVNKDLEAFVSIFNRLYLWYLFHMFIVV